jgi:hypothetical protein
VTAQGKGDAALAEARGVADALRIKGEAEAAYNAKVAASLTPVLIQQPYLVWWTDACRSTRLAAARSRSCRSLEPGAERGPSASLAPSAARSTYWKYASRGTFGRRLASGPLSAPGSTLGTR